MRIPEGLRQGLQGALCGAVVVVALGFTIGGWVTDSVANDRAEMEARRSAQAVMVDVCIGQSDSDPSRQKTIAVMRESNSYIRARMVLEAGWAQMPGATAPDQNVATRCADRLAENF